MKKKSMLFLIVSIFFASISLQTTIAQSWDITGNSNATNASKLGTTNAIPLKLFANNLERVRIDTLGRVGINTSNPLNLLTVKLNGSTPASSWLSGGSSLPVFLGFGENQATGFNLATAANSAGLRPVLNTRRSRGTLAAPTSVADNDYLASFVSSGYDGSGFQNPATIDFYVDGAPSAGNVPARISFVTGSNAGNRLERLKVGSTGDVSIVSGDLIMGSAAKTIQFATPIPGSAAMMTLFPSGAQNPDRMVISHSPFYQDWGLQYQDDPDKFNFLSGGTSVLTADLGGKRVGIGTSSPGFKLDVVGRARLQAGEGGSAGTWFTNLANTAEVAFAGMQTDNLVGFYGSGVGWGLTMNTANGQVDVRSGNLVMGSAAKTIQFATPVAGSVGMMTLFPSGISNPDRMVISHSPAYPTWGLQYQDDPDKFNFLSGGTPVLTADLGSQRVGIGTSAPAYKLDVCGTIRAKEVRVESGWCDYVFAKDYHLRALETVAAYIEKNQHLPGIPSAKEIEENGLPVAEMQTKMMEKVEEMTLYAIQLNDKIKLLEKKIDELTRRKK